MADPAVQQLRAYLATKMADIDRPRAIDEVWEDYEQNAAQLLGMLDEVAEGGSEAANRGHLPTEIAERVQALTRRPQPEQSLAPSDAIQPRTAKWLLEHWIGGIFPTEW